MPDDAVGSTASAPANAGAPGEHLFAALGMSDVEVEGADLAVEMPAAEHVAQSRGALQGGLIASLIDVVASRLAVGGAQEGTTPVTSEMSIHFLAPIVEGPARAEGTVLRRGRRSIIVHVDVHDLATERLAAVSTIAFTVLDP